MSEATALLRLDRTDRGAGTLRIEVTPRRVVAAVLALQALVLVAVALPRLGYPMPAFRATVAVLYLSVVPGYLLLRILDVEPGSYVEFALYAVGLSLTLLMALATAANFALLAVGVARPFTELPMVLALGGAVLALTGVFYWRARGSGTASTTVALSVRDLTSPWTLGLSLLPFLGVYGALALAVYTDNRLLLALYALIALVPVAVAAGKLPQRLHPYALWTISLALLLQNTLSNPYLAWGDQVKEAGLVLTVLEKGAWTPATAPAFGNKYSMLRIVVLHPVYDLLSGIEVVWLFKIVHPLLFSITPVVLYFAYRKQTDATAAFFGSFLFLSVFSFFVVLSRNTRTSTAILFLAFLALLIGDEALDDARAKLLAILFIASIVVSHYGVSYMVLAAIVAVVPTRWVLRRLVEYRRSDDSPFVFPEAETATGRRRATTSVAFVVLYGAVTFAWYIYASPNARTFSLLVGFGERFFQKLRSVYVANPDATSATVNIITSDWRSVTIEWLKLYNVGIGLLIGIGLLAVVAGLLYRGSERSFDVEYVAYAGVFLALFGVTFLPVERFNTARTFPTTLVFFAPLFVVGIGAVVRSLSRGTRALGRDLPVRRLVVACSVAVVLGYFLLNVGFVSATVTHEYSPNVLVEKERVMEGGHPIEQEYFYKQHPTVYKGAATEWIGTHAERDAAVYSSVWPGQPRLPFGYDREKDASRSVRYRTAFFAPNGSIDGDAYVYLGPMSEIGNVVFLPAGGHFGFRFARVDELASRWADKSRVYDSGGSAVYR